MFLWWTKVVKVGWVIIHDFHDFSSFFSDFCDRFVHLPARFVHFIVILNSSYGLFRFYLKNAAKNLTTGNVHLLAQFHLKNVEIVLFST